jgi:hypothetical protein
VAADSARGPGRIRVRLLLNGLNEIARRSHGRTQAEDRT